MGTAKKEQFPLTRALMGGWEGALKMNKIQTTHTRIQELTLLLKLYVILALFNLCFKFNGFNLVNQSLKILYF